MPEDIGQRRLAAIVFTDVAGFSSRTCRDEEKTLRRVRQDLELLATLSAERSGKIVKNTGDGLLISFGSAIDAVTFAVVAQRTLAARNEALPPEDRLEHRMGIHLGDVFISESDAMGDGVNIAARLQSEAAPGGICVSQTVYDVVKNKLAIKAVALGPRDLKNIREAVHVYRIIVDAERSLAGGAAPGEVRRSRLTRLVPLVGIGLAVVIIAAVIARAHRRREALTPAPVLSGGAAVVKPPPAVDARSARVAWVRERLAARGGDNPLVVRIPPRRLPGGRGMPAREFSVSLEGGDVVINAGGGTRRRSLGTIEPGLLAAIAAALAREARAADAAR